MIIQKRYMKVPVSRYSERKSFIFYDNNNSVIADYKIQLCTSEPEYYFYIDIRYLKGATVRLEIEPYIDFSPEFTDELPDNPILYKEKFRPAAHFTAAMGWINDPNGLIYVDGIYHLFYQHNPAGPKWSNMHWGHAVSSDLLHWKEKEIALFPDNTGTMYSGCALEDKNNLSQLKTNANNPVLLYYTACSAGMKTSEGSLTSQCLAYSNDNGKTFKKYKNNPVISNIINDNRDPKVIYCEEENCFYMVLFLNKDEYAMFTSDNLTEWTEVQRITIDGDGECPDFYPLEDQNGKRFWVLTGAHDRYIIGTIKNKIFTPEQNTYSLHFGNKSYAAQSYSGLPDNRRIRISWNRSSVPESYFNSSMCTPAEMSLISEDDRTYLCINPIPELKSIEHSCSESELTGKAHDICIDIKFTDKAIIYFCICGFKFTVNTQEHKLSAQDMDMPLCDYLNHVNIRIINDTTSVEIYSGSGKAFGVYEHISDYDLNFIKYELIQGNADISVDANEINNIWE